MSTSTDDQIEQAIQNKGKTAPRVTPDDMQANVVGEYYFTAEAGVRGMHLAGSGDYIPPQHPTLSMLTFCVLVLRNGFTVVGKSACVSPENYDEEIGKTVARANAEREIWPLMGYALQEKLHQSNSESSQ